MKISQSDLLAQTELSASTQKLATEKKRKKRKKYLCERIMESSHPNILNIRCIFFFFRRALWVRPKAFQHPPTS